MSITTETILQQINLDRSLGSQILFPHRHPQLSPEFHVTVMDMWRASDEFVSMEAFRQGAKTTLSEEFLLMEALYGNYSYCLIFGETYTKACQRIEGIKHEINTNQKIIQLFGKNKASSADGGKWSENKIVLSNGVAIEAHGWEEEIRGYLHLSKRPDRAYLDDIETEESVRDTNAVDRNWKKLHKQLMPAMDKDLGKIRLTGTPLADDCMIRRAAASPRWVHGHFPICDRNIDDPEAQSLWPERYPMEWIREKRDSFSDEGMLREFMQEYMLVATGSQGKPFTEDMLRYEDVAPYSYSPRTIIIDPARTVEVKKSDQTGHVTVSKMGTKIYVHQSGGEYWQPDEIVDGAFRMSIAHKNAEVAIEKNSLDNWLLQPMRAKMLLTGNSIKLRVMNAPQDRDKAAFIMGLRSFFIAGDIIFVGGKSAHAQLVSQVLNFPTGKKDILNALAYSLRIFSGTPIYGEFSESNIIRNYELPRKVSLLLALNATSSDTVAVLCSLEGQHLTVLADWVTPLLPNDALPDIKSLINALYPGREITAWIPADQFDQIGRNPLSSALKSIGLRANRAEYSSMSRGTLSPMLRTELRGSRLLKVCDNADNTLQALSAGYNWPIKPNGERSGEPEHGTAKTLIEALETLTFAINKRDNAPKAFKPNATNALGKPYISAMGK